MINAIADFRGFRARTNERAAVRSCKSRKSKIYCTNEQTDRQRPGLTKNTGTKAGEQTEKKYKIKKTKKVRKPDGNDIDINGYC